MNFSKNIGVSKNQIIFALVVLGLAVVVSLGIILLGQARQPKYVAVRLVTGEVYFGQISWWPRVKLSNVWFIQQTPEGELSLDRMQNLVWQPVEPMRLARDKIVFWTYLAPTSPVVQAIEGRAQPMPQQPGGVLPPGIAPGLAPGEDLPGVPAPPAPVPPDRP
jgi:hypothetical protein